MLGNRLSKRTGRFADKQEKQGKIMRHRWPLVLICLMLAHQGAVSPSAGSGTCTLSGVVEDDGAPIADAAVTHLGSNTTIRTDARGEFSFGSVPSGDSEILFVADGFVVSGDRIDCPEGESIQLEVDLQPVFGEELVVTGTRTEKRLADVPVHTQLIPRKDIEVIASRTLADAVEYASGLRVENNCQNCNFAQIRMLGLEGPYSQILVDGMPTLSSLAMVYGIEQMPARLIDSIEVVKGGGSATYGAGAVSGVINLITHRPSTAGAEIELLALDRDGNPGRSLSAVADWVSSDSTKSLSVLGQADDVDPIDVDGDGFTDAGVRELLSVGANFNSYVLDSRGRFSVEATYIDAYRRGGDLLNIDRPAGESELAEEVSTERLAVSLSWLHQPSSRFDYRATASLADTARDSYYGGGFDPNAYGTTSNPLWILDLQANRYLESAALTFGAQFTDDELEDAQPGYDRFLEENYENLGAYLQDDRKIAPSVSLLYGARIDSHSALDDPIVSPRAALMWSPSSDVTVRASVATGFRAPVVFDEDLHITQVGGEGQVIRNAADLVEESSLGYLVGAEWRPTFLEKGSASVSVNLFRTDLEDLFNTIEADDFATPEAEFLRVNQGDAQVEGVEIAGAIRWGSRFSTDFGLVHQTSRFGEPEPDFGSLDFFRTPETYGSFGLIWQATRNMDLFTGFIYTGSMKVPHYAGFIDEDRLETSDSFLTWDVTLNRRFKLDSGLAFKLTVGARNITDEFQPDLDQGPDRDAGYVYGPRSPRTLFAGMTVEL